MNQFLSGVFAVFVLSATAQTPLIAHKSHSGSSDSYFISANSNFGDTPAMRKHWEEQYILTEQRTFIPLNDSTMVLEVRNFEQQLIRTDTLANKNKYSAPMFEYKYQDSVQREERRKVREEELKPEQEQIKSDEEQKKQLELKQQQINAPTTPKKKEKKSYLLFLFGITGGGMLLMRLFNRSKGTEPSIARL